MSLEERIECYMKGVTLGRRIQSTRNVAFIGLFPDAVKRGVADIGLEIEKANGCLTPQTVDRARFKLASAQKLADEGKTSDVVNELADLTTILGETE